MIAGRFTLLIPTFNRPADLARLLAYLSRHRVDFPVLILDSSAPDVQARNRETVRTLLPAAWLESFPADTPPWAKFWRGSEMAETEYCSLCADDDLILPDSLSSIVAFLDDRHDYSVAHGWYFMFYLTDHLGITRSEYSGGSIDRESAVDRLFALFKRYEAVTYGVYRTQVLRAVLRDVQPLESMLGKELLGGALTMAHGKAARLPVFYYGRSHSPSHPYSNWHPLDFLSSSPDRFYREYGAYRGLLLSALGSKDGHYSQEELAILIDLIHLRYLSEYVKPGTMEYLVERVMARTPKAELMQGLWGVMAREAGTLSGALTGNALIRRIRDRFFPMIRLHHFRKFASPVKEEIQRSVTADGRPREYRLYPDFLASLEGNAALRGQVQRAITALNRYG